MAYGHNPLSLPEIKPNLVGWDSRLQEALEKLAPLKLPSYTVAGAPNAATAGAGAQIYVTNEVGGAVPAFSDGTNWRRVTDRTVIA